MIDMIKKFVKDEINHWMCVKMDQKKASLEEEIALLQRQYDDTHSNYIWEKLQDRKRQLANLMLRLKK